MTKPPETNKNSKAAVHNLSEQVASFTQGVEALYAELRQVQRECQRSKTENIELWNKIQEFRKSYESLAKAWRRERALRQEDTQASRASQESTRRATQKLADTLEAERERRRIEANGQREMMLLEVQVYREEIEKLLQKLEEERKSTATAVAWARRALAENEDLKRKLFLANEEARNLGEKAAAAEARAARSEQDLERVRNQIQKVDRLAEIHARAQAMVAQEREQREKIESRIQGFRRENTGDSGAALERSAAEMRAKLAAFHPSRLKIEQELAELEGAHA